MSTRHEFSLELHSRFLHFSARAPMLIWLCFESLAAQHFVVRSNADLGFAITFSDLAPTECTELPSYAVLEESEFSLKFSEFLRHQFGFFELKRSCMKGKGNGFVKIYNCRRIEDSGDFLACVEDFLRVNYDLLPKTPKRFFEV